DRTAVSLYAEFLQTKILDIADDADGRNYPIDLDRLRATLPVLERRTHLVDLLVELGHLGPSEDLDALLLECFAGEGCDLCIFGRQDLRQHLDPRDLSAERAIEGGKLNSDCTRADHQ